MLIVGGVYQFENAELTQSQRFLICQYGGDSPDKIVGLGHAGGGLMGGIADMAAGISRTWRCRDEGGGEYLLSPVNDLYLTGWWGNGSIKCYRRLIPPDEDPRSQHFSILDGGNGSIVFQYRNARGSLYDYLYCEADGDVSLKGDFARRERIRWKPVLLNPEHVVRCYLYRLDCVKRVERSEADLIYFHAKVNDLSGEHTHYFPVTGGSYVSNAPSTPFHYDGNLSHPECPAVNIRVPLTSPGDMSRAGSIEVSVYEHDDDGGRERLIGIFTLRIGVPGGVATWQASTQFESQFLGPDAIGTNAFKVFGAGSHYEFHFVVQ